MTTKTTIEAPGGATNVILSSLKGTEPTLSASVDWRGRDLLEFNGRLSKESLVRVKLLFPDAVAKEKNHGKERLLDLGFKRVEGIVRCPNKNCITAQPREPVRAGFKVVSLDPLKLQCDYCGRYADRDVVAAQLSS